MLRDSNAKEVLTPMSGEKFIFPIADGTVKLSGGDQDLRTATLIRDHPDRGEEQGNLLGESDGRPKLHKKPREACKSSWNPRRNQKSFTLTIPWNSAKLVKISPESLHVYTTQIGD